MNRNGATVASVAPESRCAAGGLQSFPLLHIQSRLARLDGYGMESYRVCHNLL